MSVVRNRELWDSKKGYYPFHVESRKGVVKPEKVDRRTYGHFISVPFVDKVCWGFLTAAAADAFVAKYGGARV